MRSSPGARRLCPSPVDFPFRVATLPALIRTALVAGAVVASPGIAAEKRLSEWFPGLVWSLPTAWSPLGEPRGGDLVYINHGPGIAFGALLGIGETFDAVTIDGAAGPAGVGYLDLPGPFRVPVPFLDLAAFPANLLLPLSHLRTGNLTIGTGQRGALLQTGGRLTVNLDMRVGNDAGGTGFYTVAVRDTADVMSVGRDAFVGAGGTGIIVMEDETFTVGRDLVFGALATGDGTLFTAGGVNVGRDEIVGDEGKGRVMQAPAFHTVTQDLILGRGLEGSGEMTLLPFAELAVGRNAVIGAAGRGDLRFSEGAFRVGGNLTLGSAATGRGLITVDASTAINVGGDLFIGDAGRGEIRWLAGTSPDLQIGGSLSLGHSASGQGELHLSGGRTAVTGSVVLGGGGIGRLDLSDGSVMTVGMDVVVGRSNPSVLVPPIAVPGMTNPSVGDYIRYAAEATSDVVLRRALEALPFIRLGDDLRLEVATFLANPASGAFAGVFPNAMAIARGASLDVTGTLTVGAEGRGLVGHFSDDFLRAGGAVVGGAGEGVLYAGTDSQVQFGSLIVGSAGTGVMIVAGDMTVTGNVEVGTFGTGVGVVITKEADERHIGGDLVIGRRGQGSWWQTDFGGLTVAGRTVIGELAGSRGLLDLNRGQLHATGVMVIGDRGIGEVRTGRSHVVQLDSDLFLGVNQGASGSIDAQGGWWTVTGSAIVGSVGEGRVTLRDTDLHIGRELWLGSSTGGSGALEVHRGSYVRVLGGAIVGAHGDGRIAFQSVGDGAVLDVDGDLVFGMAAGTSGTFTSPVDPKATPSDFHVYVGGNLDLGAGGVGGFEQIGGTVIVDRDMRIGRATNASGTYSTPGAGRLLVHGNLAVGADFVAAARGWGGFFQDGAASEVEVLGAVLVGASEGAISQYVLAGGRLVAADVYVGRGGRFLVSGGGMDARAFATDGGGSADFGETGSLLVGRGDPRGGHRTVAFTLWGGSVRLDTLDIGPDGMVSQTGGSLITNDILFRGGAVTGTLQSTRHFRTVGSDPLVFGGRLRNEGVVTFGGDFTALDGVHNTGRFDIVADRRVAFLGAGLVNDSLVTLRGTLVTSTTVVADAAEARFEQVAGSHTTDLLQIGRMAGIAGHYDMTGGTLNAAVGAIGADGSFRLAGSRLDVGVLTNAGSFSMTGSALVGRVQGAGHFEWSGTGDIVGDGTLQIDVGGRFDTTASGRIETAIVNEGRWTSHGTGTQVYRGRIDQDGDFQLASGIARWQGGTHTTGYTQIREGTTLSLGGGRIHQFDGILDNDGLVQVGDASGTANAVLAGNGIHTGKFAIDIGSLLRLDSARMLFSGPNAAIDGKGVLTFLSGRTEFAAGSSVDLQGSILFLGGAVHFLAGSHLRQPEFFIIEGSALELSTGLAQTYGRDITLSAGGFGGTDPFALTAGTLRWTGGTLFGPAALTLQTGTTLSVSGPGHKVLDREVIVEGRGTWAGGDVLGSGLMHVAGSGAFSVTDGGWMEADVTNRGALTVDARDQLVRLGGFLDAPSGTVDIEAGTLRLEGGGTSRSPFAVAAGGVIDFAGGAFVFEGAQAGVSGEGAAHFTGGRVTFRDGAMFGALGAERIAGGTLDLATNARHRFNPSLTIESGSLLVNTAVAQFVLPATTELRSGTLGGTDQKVVTAGSFFTWSGGTLDGGNVAVDSGARMNIVPGGPKTLSAKLTNAGVLTWTGSDIDGLGPLNNRTEGLIEITGAGALGPALFNEGRVRIDAPLATVTLLGGFDNDGTVEVATGTLQVFGPFENLAGGTLTGGRFVLGGTLRHQGIGIHTIAANLELAGTGAFVRSGSGQSLLDTWSTVATDGTFTIRDGRDITMAARNLAVDGVLRVGNGSTFLAQAANLGGIGTVAVGDGGAFLWTGATLNGGGTLRVEAGGVLRISGGNNHDMDRRTLQNAGKVEWQAGAIRGGNAGRIDNSGLWIDATTGTTDINRAYGGGAGEVYNGGIWRKTGDGTTRIFSQEFNNAGTVELQAGVFELHGGGTTSAGGRYEIAAGATLGLRNSYRFSGDTVVSGAGLAEATGGVLTLENAVAFSRLALAGNATLAGTHQFSGHLLWTTGNMNGAGMTTIVHGAQLTIAGANDHDLDRRTLFNSGTVAWEGGNVRGGNGTIIVNKGLWLDRVTANAVFNRAYGGSDDEWLNIGTYRKSTNTITTFAHTLRNHGVFEVDAGTLRLSGSTTHATGSRIEVAGGAVLEMVGTQTFQDGVTLDGPARMFGTAVVTGKLTAADFDIAGGTLAGTHTLYGSYRWSGGNLNNAGTTTIAAGTVFTLADTGNHDLDRRTFVNDGTVDWQGGNVRGGNASSIVNNGLWTDRIAGNAGFGRDYGGGDGEWVNNGTYRKSTDTITTFAHTLRNRGVFEVNEGTLRLSAGTTHEGGSRIAVAGGALLEMYATQTFHDGVTLDGLTRLYGTAVVTGNLTATNFEITGGTLSGDHTLRGNYRWSSGNLNTSGLTVIASDAVFTITGTGNHDMDRRLIVNRGEVRWESGAIRGGNGSVIENAALWHDQTIGVSDIDRAYGGSGGRFLNAGTYVKTGNGVTRIQDQPFDNTGLVYLDAGTLALHGGGTMSSTSRIGVADGATLGIHSFVTFEAGSIVSGPGTTLVASGVANVQGAVSISNLVIGTGGQLAGTHTLSGHVRWAEGNLNGAGTTTIASGSLLTITGASNHDLDRRTLVNDGSVVWEGGNIRGGNGTSIVNNGLWLDRLAGNAAFNREYGGGDGEWVNNGTYRKTTDTITTFAHTLRNRGEFDVDAGTLRLAGGTTHETGSRISVASGALLEIHSSHTFQSGVTLDGPVKLIGTAVVTGDLTASDFEIAGGVLAGNHSLHGNYRWRTGNLNVAGSTTIASDASFTITGANDHDLDRRTLVNDGKVVWEGGNIRGGNGTSIVNNGLWLDSITADAQFNRAYGGSDGEWVNNGTYRKSTNAITTFAHTLRNRGEFDVDAGTLRLAGGTTHETRSRITVASGALLEIHSTHTFQTGATLDGPTKLIGTAIVTGDLTASDFEIAGGVLAGDHTLHGNYRWSRGHLNSAGRTVLASDAVFTIATGSDHDMDRRALVNRGEVRWQAGAIRSGNAGRIENAGLWIDETRGTTEINRAYGGTGGNFLNSGTYRKTGDGTTRILQQPFDNPGELHVEAGRMELNGGVVQIHGNRLTGGTWHAGSGATIAVAGNPLVTVNEGNVWLQGVGSVFTPIDGIAENRGSFRITGGRRFTTQGAFTNTGHLLVGVGSALIVPGRLTLGGSVAGNGAIRAESTLVRGRLRPGASPGELSIEGDVALDAAASLEIEIAGLAAGIEHDVLRVGGVAMLGGALEVSLLQSFAGLEVASFTFLTAHSVIGTFDGIADGDRVFTVDGSGSFLVDYTSDAVLLTSFQTAPVPEPQTWMLLGAGLALLGAVKRRLGLRR
jgi:hypothetical protein